MTDHTEQQDYTTPAVVVAVIIQLVLVYITGSAQIVAAPVVAIPFEIAAGSFEIAYVIDQLWRKISPFD